MIRTGDPRRRGGQRGATPRTIRIQELFRQKVYDAAGKNLGRVYDVEAARDGDVLRVTALLVGPWAWVSRFGWTSRPHGKRISGDRIATLAPRITLRDREE